MKNKNITIKHSSADLSNTKIPELDQALVWLVRFQLVILLYKCLIPTPRLAFYGHYLVGFLTEVMLLGCLTIQSPSSTILFVSSMCVRQTSKEWASGIVGEALKKRREEVIEN